MDKSQHSHEFDWEKIDDHEFVYLCSDLLEGLGFTDLQVHGDGPDGGLDLIATELVSFAIQGTQPFRWGVQCKFSKKGGKRSVNDSEIRDVTGILGSDRYITHNLRGYMVMTNRRMSQNVVERLAGINRRADYKATYVDEVRLVHMLLDNLKLTDKYFGKFKDRILELGNPKLIVDLENDLRGFDVDIEVQAPFNDNDKYHINGLVDTGSSITFIPQKILDNLGLKPISTSTHIITTGGSVFYYPYILDIILTDVKMSTFMVYGWEKNIALIGRDILRNFTILFDGPKHEMKIF